MGQYIFHGGLTRKLSDELENIQKIMLSLLSKYVGLKFSYMESCIFFQCEPLELQRLEQCYTFIKRSLRHPVHSTLFQRRKVRSTRSTKHTFVEFNCRNQRYYRSPLPFLTRLANQLLST